MILDAGVLVAIDRNEPDAGNKDSIVTADFGDFAQLTGHLGTGSPVVHHWR